MKVFSDFNAINFFSLFWLILLVFTQRSWYLGRWEKFSRDATTTGRNMYDFFVLIFFCDKKVDFFALFFFQSCWEPLFIGGNSPSSSNRKHCFGGDSVAVAISWNFSESKAEKNYIYKDISSWNLYSNDILKQYDVSQCVYACVFYSLTPPKRLLLMSWNFERFPLG